MLVIWFGTPQAADRWARSFAHGRKLSNLPPLRVVEDAGQWAVDNPTYGGPGRKPQETAQVRVVKIRSKSDPGKKYPVSIRADGSALCPCVGFKYHGICDHVHRARARLHKEAS